MGSAGRVGGTVYTVYRDSVILQDITKFLGSNTFLNANRHNYRGSIEKYVDWLIH